MKYKVIGCANPAGQTGVDYACCRAYSQEIIEPKSIFNEMELCTTYTRSDIVGVASALKEYIKQHLLEGKKVDLKDGVTDLGIIAPAMKSRCFRQSAITASDFNPAGYITGAKVEMRPSNDLKREVRLKAKLERVPSTLMP